MKASSEGQLLTQVFNATRTRNSQFIKSLLHPALLAETEFNKNLLLLAAQIAKGEPKSVQFLGWAFNISSSDGRTSTVSAVLKLQCTYRDGLGSVKMLFKSKYAANLCDFKKLQFAKALISLKLKFGWIGFNHNLSRSLTFSHSLDPELT